MQRMRNNVLKLCTVDGSMDDNSRQFTLTARRIIESKRLKTSRKQDVRTGRIGWRPRRGDSTSDGLLIVWEEFDRVGSIGLVLGSLSPPDGMPVTKEANTMDDPFDNTRLII
mmetsp:Transcript_18642/g.39164  ORF Transcript_18642/g.39164 Transcript_18642/m.39164 type:complete len:112 (-) Transcript_18642:2139-2474(-)